MDHRTEEATALCNVTSVEMAWDSSSAGCNFFCFFIITFFLRKIISSFGQYGSQKWRVAGSEPLGWRSWTGDCVVFNPLSGQTHLLDIVTGQVLKLIMSESSSFDDLRLEISTFLEVDNDNHLAQTISDILSRMDEVGLIEPAG